MFFNQLIFIVIKWEIATSHFCISFDDTWLGARLLFVYEIASMIFPRRFVLTKQFSWVKL